MAVELERVLARLGESRGERCVDLGDDEVHELLGALAIVAPSAAPRRREPPALAGACRSAE
ncbi:hypothetical protein ACIGO7_07530 [Streptomyces virginiae]|uniref:hypothetical protein n=1 Tax=Streptomyces virginiae TaxID=1961 RepID=UPI00344C5C4D